MAVRTITCLPALAGVGEKALALEMDGWKLSSMPTRGYAAVERDGVQVRFSITMNNAYRMDNCYRKNKGTGWSRISDLGVPIKAARVAAKALQAEAVALVDRASRMGHPEWRGTSHQSVGNAQEAAKAKAEALEGAADLPDLPKHPVDALVLDVLRRGPVRPEFVAGATGLPLGILNRLKLEPWVTQVEGGKLALTDAYTAKVMAREQARIQTVDM